MRTKTKGSRTRRRREKKATEEDEEEEKKKKKRKKRERKRRKRGMERKGSALQHNCLEALGEGSQTGRAALDTGQEG